MFYFVLFATEEDGSVSDTEIEFVDHYKGACAKRGSTVLSINQLNKLEMQKACLSFDRRLSGIKLSSLSR